MQKFLLFHLPLYISTCAALAVDVFRSRAKNISFRPPTIRNIHISTFLIIDVSLTPRIASVSFGGARRKIPNGSENKQALNEERNSRAHKIPPYHFEHTAFPSNNKQFSQMFSWAHKHNGAPFTMASYPPVSAPAKANKENFYYYFCAEEKWVRMVNWWYGNERI